MTNELLTLLAQFGRNIQNSPDVIPAFGNYYQDAGPGESYIGNLTLVNGVRMYENGDNTSELQDFQFQWFVDGELKFQSHHPKVKDLVPDDYDGVLRVQLIIKHLPTGTIYERSQWAFFDMIGISPTLEGGERPMRFGVFYDFYPDVDPYAFAVLEADLDGDGMVSTSDLLAVIAGHESDNEDAATLAQLEDDEGAIMEARTYEGEEPPAPRTIYDWSKAQPETMWMCTNKEGDIEEWKKQPVNTRSGHWNDKKGGSIIGFLSIRPNSPYKGKIADSLEQRPA